MSFYGNIKRVQSSPFVFDKYYPNRTTMDLNATTDNVYIGRYVLVKYTVKDSLDINSESTYFDKYVEDTDRPGLKKVYKGYKFNADKDIERYHDTFDGTVWQKIYTNTAGGEQLERYILIAELNSAVPRMELNTVSPMYYGENNKETWREPAIIPEASSEDAYTLEMPNVLQFDVGEMASDFYAKDLINPQYRYEMYEDGSSTKDHILSGSTPIPHDVRLSDLHNYKDGLRYSNIDTSHPGPINCPMDKHLGFTETIETKAITNLLQSLHEKGTLVGYENFHSTGGLIYQRPCKNGNGFEISQDLYWQRPRELKI